MRHEGKKTLAGANKMTRNGLPGEMVEPLKPSWTFICGVWLEMGCGRKIQSLGPTLISCDAVVYLLALEYSFLRSWRAVGESVRRTNHRGGVVDAAKSVLPSFTNCAWGWSLPSVSWPICTACFLTLKKKEWALRLHGQWTGHWGCMVSELGTEAGRI